MLDAFLESLVSLAATALVIGFVGSLFLGDGSGQAQPADSGADDEGDLPPSGIWDHRKAWGRWEDPLERERYFQARGIDRNEY